MRKGGADVPLRTMTELSGNALGLICSLRFLGGVVRERFEAYSLPKGAAVLHEAFCGSLPPCGLGGEVCVAVGGRSLAVIFEEIAAEEGLVGEA